MWQMTSDTIRDLFTSLDGLFFTVNVMVPVFLLFVSVAIKVAVLVILIRVGQLIRAARDWVDDHDA